MHTFINLLIGLLIGLFIYNLFYFRIREGQCPMVGSIMFPTSYKGITDVLHKKIEVKEKGNTDIFTQADTEVVKKEDERVDTDVRTQTWLDKKKDVDEKKVPKLKFKSDRKDHWTRVASKFQSLTPDPK